MHLERTRAPSALLKANALDKVDAESLTTKNTYDIHVICVCTNTQTVCLCVPVCVCATECAASVTGVTRVSRAAAASLISGIRAKVGQIV